MAHSSKYKIEIATTDFATTEAAVEGGADRIELCSALSEGGLTPSFGLIRKCREAFSLPLFPIIRPRGGDFLYSDAEFEIMLHDVKQSKELGCDGVVAGLLKKDGGIDTKRTAKLVAAAYPMEVTFHRAFDRCKDPFEALEQIIDMGCQRILTSGQQPMAPAGMALISQLVQAAGARLIIMPGSGVRKDNIGRLATVTGAEEFHTSLRGHTPSKMEFIHPAFEGSKESYTNALIDAEEVRLLRKQLPTE